MRRSKPQIEICATDAQRLADACARIARGKGDAKCGAQARSAVDADVAGVFLHDAVGYRQAQTGAAAHAFGGKEGIVNLRDIFGSDPDTIVGTTSTVNESFFAVMRRQRDPAIAVGD